MGYGSGRRSFRQEALTLTAEKFAFSSRCVNASISKMAMINIHDQQAIRELGAIASEDDLETLQSLR